MNQKIHRLGAAAVLVIAFGVLLKTAAPTVSFWDCGEFLSCSYSLGVPHPPGSPLFVLLGRLFTFLPVGKDPAVRVNLISVLASSLAVMLLYLVTVRLIRLADRRKRERGGWTVVAEAVGGWTAALMLAFSGTFWFNGVEAEVYGVSILMMVLAVWLGLRWLDHPQEPGGLRSLVFASYLMGLAGGVHLLCLLTVPTLLLFVWFQDRSLLKDPRLWALVPVLFVLGYSTYVSLYIRSGLNPMIDENDPETWKNFMMFIRREQYGSQSMLLTVFDRKAPFWDYQLWSMYLKYFLAQFPVPGLRFTTWAFRKATGPQAFPVQVSVIPYLLGAWGMWSHGRRNSRQFLAVFALFLLAGLGLVVYLNMGDPQPRERDYAFVGSFTVFAIWIGMGAEDVLRRLVAWRPGPLPAALAVAFLAMPIGLAAANFHDHNRSGNYVPNDYGYNILSSCAPNAILFTNGDNDTFPLWYQQVVVGVRRDVRVVNLSLLNTDWYIKQLRDQKPRVPIHYTDDYIDNALTAYTRDAVLESGRFCPKDREVTEAGLTWTVKAPSIRLLRVQDIMVMKIIGWNDWKKPVYFATTVPDENLIGLRPHLEVEGMVYRLVKGKARVINAAQTYRNLFDVYRYRGVTDPHVYRNDTTLALLVNYQAAFLQLADEYVAEGKKDRAFTVLKACESRAVPPEDWKGLVLVAGGMYRAGRMEEAQRVLRRVLALKNLDEATKLGGVAEVEMQFGEFDSASVLYTSMIRKGLNLNLALYNRAVARDRLGQLQGALEDMERLSRRTPNDPSVQKALAVIREALKLQKQGKGGE